MPDPASGARPFVIANPVAGRGRTGRELAGLLRALRAALGELDVAVTERPGHATELAAAAAAGGRPLVVSVGGDGTLNEVVNGLLGGRAAGAATGGPAAPAAPVPHLGFVSTGTGSDFCRSLGLEHGIDAAIGRLAAGHERAVDVGRARFTGRDGRPLKWLWLNVLSAGIGGLVDIYQKAAPSFVGGRLCYGQAAIRGIIACRRVPLRCRAVLPGGETHESVLAAHAIAICNGGFFGGGMHIAPGAAPDDGILEVVSFETRTRLKLVRRFATIYSGTHLQEEGVNLLRCRSLELSPEVASGGTDGVTGGRAPRPGRHGLYPLDVDGDPRGDVPLAVDLLPRALVVRC